MPTVNYVSRSPLLLRKDIIMSTRTAITSCATTACAFNHNGCTALAITVDGTGCCSTLIKLNDRGDLPVAQAHVGACQRLECVHNTDLMCTAEGISLGADTADCLSYEAR